MVLGGWGSAYEMANIEGYPQNECHSLDVQHGSSLAAHMAERAR